MTFNVDDPEKEEMGVFLEDKMPGVLNRSYKDTRVYIDLRFSATPKAHVWASVIKLKGPELDKDGNISKYIFVISWDRRVFNRIGDGIIGP
jgi:hypothetical protein